MEIRNVKIGDQFYYKTKIKSEVVDFLETKSLTTGKQKSAVPVEFDSEKALRISNPLRKGERTFIQFINKAEKLLRANRIHVESFDENTFQLLSEISTSELYINVYLYVEIPSTSYLTIPEKNYTYASTKICRK